MSGRLLTAGRRFGAALVFGLIILWFWAAAARAAAPQGELVVILEPGAVRGDVVQLAGDLEGRVVASIPQLHAYLIDLPGKGKPGKGVLDKLERSAAVKDAEAIVDLSAAEWEPLARSPLSRGPLALSLNDPLIGQAWHLSKIKAPDAWGVTTGSSSVVIAIVDTGVDYTHPDLAGKVTKGWDYGNNDADPKDTAGHGTHVAGIAAASGGNSLGSAGVCPACQLLAVKVFPDGSSSASSFTVSQGITYAADNGADVINLSLGGTGSSSTMQAAVDYAWSKGVVVVAAAGNSATSTKHYPAAYANAIAVGSTTSSDVLSSFSNYGDWVDLTAPGSSILSTVMGGSYQFWSGTSMATPVVAGAAGLAFAGLSGATQTTVRAALEQAVADLGTPGKDTTYGFGRIDLSKLLAGGASPPPPAPPPVPVPPSITTASLPGGTVGTAYSAALAATSGTPPYTWSISVGALPGGLTLNPSTGALTGTPTTSGTFGFTVKVMDSVGQAGTRAFSITVAPAPVPPPAPPPAAVDLSGSFTRARASFFGVSVDYVLKLTGGSVGSVTVRFELLRNGAVVATKNVVKTSLAPGQSSIGFSWSGRYYGTLRVRAVVDPAGLVPETNELNNTVETAVS